MSVHANAEITVLSTFFADFNAPPEGAGDDRGLGMIGSGRALDRLRRLGLVLFGGVRHDLKPRSPRCRRLRSLAETSS